MADIERLEKENEIMQKQIMLLEYCMVIESTLENVLDGYISYPEARKMLAQARKEYTQND